MCAQQYLRYRITIVCSTNKSTTKHGLVYEINRHGGRQMSVCTTKVGIRCTIVGLFSRRDTRRAGFLNDRGRFHGNEMSGTICYLC